MAEVTFPLPDLGEGLISARVLEWLVAEGDWVERNAPLVELETTKSAVEIPSPQSGRVARLHVAEDAELEVGESLVTFTVSDDQAGIVGAVPEERKPQRRVRLTLPED
ncbi:pyruvate dehydrogenase E2 component (dihydrolipoamide acetyltransferase) [Saccharopolyspora antimicrobica]|uniref:Pyruvate dehydrogenase E2 component (Dihydrolipoamide acetyltransferase) n=1 Tax=Saccharopolyspora antimicrobica TaxID=455193 RepID=A0A1I4RV19_9PSEU|nr:biotin/lipoyl-containing protein [Saccharopolyspora antimicrobica]RKT89156.1 pyruvate dehydrogenase E2 component (dihydrolipoamide acetyltransferase) [Saccharopolyspora antimicrobica]SFM56088.1 pyruvate dehydrogenase E2 component (dihydrolipoamide acetyltransferase) [Saccharopolyspora antimicrobica]